MRVWTSILSLYTLLSASGEQVKQLSYKVIESIERPSRGYTQGLFIDNGKLYESTGGYGSSLIRRIDLKTQQTEHSEKLPDHFFGEGLSPWGADRMIQLTWKKGIGIIYHQETMKLERIFRYQGEGWGISYKGDNLVMSNGSSNLFFLDPQTLTICQTLPITRLGKPVKNLNELEWVDDHIYANIWLTDEIVQIDAQTGIVTASIDCSNLNPQRSRFNTDAVLNGIAYDKSEEVFYLTGKTWKYLYKVTFQ